MAPKVSTQRIVIVSFLVDLLDITSNLVVSYLTGSAVIFAEMIQGCADLIGSLLLVIGYRQAKKPKEPRYPFGHSREVFFWSLLSSMVMLFLGSGFSIWRGYQQLRYPGVIQHQWLVLIVLAVSISTNGYAFSQSVKKLKIPGVSFRRAFQQSSQQLVKTALFRNSLGTISAVVGLFSILLYELFGLILFDALGAIIIGIIMAVFAIILITQAKSLIVGKAVSTEIMRKIRKATLEVPEIVAINRLVAVYTGSEQILVDLDVDLKEKLSTTEIERVLDKIQLSIVEEIPEVKTVRIDLNSPVIKNSRK